LQKFYNCCFVGYVPIAFSVEVQGRIPQYLHSLRLAGNNAEKRKELATSFVQSMAVESDQQLFRVLFHNLVGSDDFDFAYYEAMLALYTTRGSEEREKVALVSKCFVPLPAFSFAHPPNPEPGAGMSHAAELNDYVLGEFRFGAYYRALSSFIAVSLTNLVQWYRGKKTRGEALKEMLLVVAVDNVKGGVVQGLLASLRAFYEGRAAGPFVKRAHDNWHYVFAFVLVLPEVISQVVQCVRGRQTKRALLCNVFETFYKIAMSFQEGAAAFLFSTALGLKGWPMVTVSAIGSGLGAFGLRNAISYQLGDARNILNAWS